MTSTICFLSKKIGFPTMTCYQKCFSKLYCRFPHTLNNEDKEMPLKEFQFDVCTELLAYWVRCLRLYRTVLIDDTTSLVPHSLRHLTQ